MTRRKLGLLFERQGQFSTAYGVDRLLGFAGSPLGDDLPRTFLDHEARIPSILDQGGTSSCVAHAFAQALQMAEARAGLSPETPSRLYLYWHARKEHGGQWLDAGTYLRTCAAALRHFGAPAETHWPWGTGFTRVNRQPNWNAKRYAHPRIGGEYVAIHERGEERTRAIKLALLAGHDVAFGTRLGRSFLADKGPAFIEPPPITEDIVGNHAMLIIGWRVVAGVTWFRIVNSWGKSWRDGGLCWMRRDYIEAAYTRDLHIVARWPRVKGAA